MLEFAERISKRTDAGDFAMDEDALRKALPGLAELRIGPIAATVKTFVQSLSPDLPLGYVALDVDYCSSSKDALVVFAGDARQYLPHVLLYVDDMQFARHNPWQADAADGGIAKLFKDIKTVTGVGQDVNSYAGRAMYQMIPAGSFTLPTRSPYN